MDLDLKDSNCLLCGRCHSQLLQKRTLLTSSVSRISNYTLTPHRQLNNHIETTVRFIQCPSCSETVGYMFKHHPMHTPPASPHAYQPEDVTSLSPISISSLSTSGEASSSSSPPPPPLPSTETGIDPIQAYASQLEAMEAEVMLRSVHRLEGMCCWYGDRVIWDHF